MNNRESEQAAVFMTRLTFQVLIDVVFGVFMLTYYYPKVMLPLIVCAGIVLAFMNYR